MGLAKSKKYEYLRNLWIIDFILFQLIADYFHEKVGYLLSEEDVTVFYDTAEFKDICCLHAGEETYRLFCQILSLTDEGRDKVADRVAELKEIPRYNIEYHETRADMQRKGEIWPKHGPNWPSVDQTNGQGSDSEIHYFSGFLLKFICWNIAISMNCNRLTKLTRNNIDIQPSKIRP